jgi:hypothetical protein
MSRRLISVVALLVLATAACSGGGKNKSANAKAVREIDAPVALTSTAPEGLKVGLLVANAGAGKDVAELAAGAYVAEYRLNAAKADRMHLVVEDDLGTAEGAVAAVGRLADQGVVGIVNASLGEPARAASAEATTRGIAMLFPYAGDPALAAGSAFVTGPTDDQVAAKLVTGAKDAKKIAVVHQVGAYGSAGREALARAGLAVATDINFDPATDAGGAARTVVASGSDLVVAWTELDGALRLLSDLKTVGTAAPVLFASQAAVPAFGRAQKGLAAPAATDGLLSAGLWAGPWTPTGAVDAFYKAREQASAAGARTDLSNADLRAHDAVLAIVAASAAAKSSDPGAVLAGLRSLGDVPGASGVPLHFAQSKAVADSDVALMTYSTVDSGSGRVPNPATAGGQWIAVDGTYQLPAALAGLDNAFGG